MRRMITGEQITKINKLNQVDANPAAEATELLDTVKIGDTVYSLEGGVKSVNGQIGRVVLTASDIKADDQTTIQENIDRIDDDIATIEGNIPDISRLATKEELAGKLDKVTTEGPGTNYIRVYTIDNNGNQTITNASSYRGNDCIVIRDSTANINVPDTPGNQYHATSKKYVDEGLNTKDDVARLDGVAANGGQTTYKLTSGNTPNTIASRNASGQINVADPTAGAHAANKRYVDNSIPDLSNMVTTDTEQTINGKKTFNSGITAPNLTAQGSNQSTVYGSTQFVHTFADNTKLNLQFPVKSGNKTIATTDDLSNMVTTDTEQTITADKSIKGTLSFKRYDDTVAVRIYNTSNNDITIAGWKNVNETTTAKTTYKLPLYDTEKYKTIATVDQIPTNYATTDTDQAITGKKTFGTLFGKTGMILGDESEKTNSNMTVLPTGEIHLGTYKNYKSTILNLPKKSGTFTLVTNDDIADMVTLGGNQRITGIKLFDQGYIGITQNMDTGKAIKINADGVIDIYEEGGITNGLSKCHLHFPRTPFTATLATTDQIKTYYKHNITLGRTDNQNYVVQLELITTSSTKMDYAAVVAWMKNNAPGDTTAVGCTGFKLNSAGSITDIAIEAYKYSGGDYVRVNWYNPQKNTFSVQNANKFIASSVHEIK